MTETDFGDFERHQRENQGVVYQIAYGVLANAADAEDVTQDVFLRAYRKLASLREPEKFRAWVARISRRLALNRRRDLARARRRENLWLEAAPASTDVEVAVADREFHARLHDEIARLPEKLRAVFSLCAIDGFSAGSVGAMLGIPEGTVRSRLHLARKRLLRAIGTGAAIGAIFFGVHYAYAPRPPSATPVTALSEWRSPTAVLLRPSTYNAGTRRLSQ